MVNIKYNIFSLKNRLLGQAKFSLYTNILKNERLTKDELSQINFEKRKKLLKHSYENSIFYKELYDTNNFHPDMLTDERSWDKVPVVTKEMIKVNYHRIISSNISKNRTFESSTGGSTGFPLKVLHDKRFPYEVLGWRMLRWWKLLPSDNIAIIYRQRFNNYLRLLINHLMWFPTKRLFLDASSMSSDDIIKFLNKFNKIKPPILQGYVGAIEKVAIFALKNNIKCHAPKVCWVTSSPITEVQRSTISRAFNCNILDQYGCGEVFWLASECPAHEGLHVFNDCRHIDILNEMNNSIIDKGLGNVAITDLENFAFPIIKYLNGDRSEYLNKECKCGLPFPLLHSIKGRITDCIYIKSEGIIGGDYLTTIFDDFPDAIQGFQIEQFKDYSLEVKYVPSMSIEPNDLAAIISKVKQTLIKKTLTLIPITFKAVENIDDNRGKIRFIISHIKKKN